MGHRISCDLRPFLFFFHMRILPPKNSHTTPTTPRELPAMKCPSAFTAREGTHSLMPQRKPNNGGRRRDLTSHQLFYLSFLRIYVSSSFRTVASRFNRYFSGIHPRLKPKECETIYLNLHDSEDQNWVRARDMNREEPVLLKVMMDVLGVPRDRWAVELVQPVGPMGCRRVSG